MHRTLAIAALLLVTATAAALPVDVATARIAATHFLQQKGLIEKGDTLAFYSIDSNVDPATGATASFYVFNYGSQGFIIMPPLATLPAIIAMCSGVTSTSPWPMPAQTRTFMLFTSVGKAEL